MERDRRIVEWLTTHGYEDDLPSRSPWGVTSGLRTRVSKSGETVNARYEWPRIRVLTGRGRKCAERGSVELVKLLTPEQVIKMRNREWRFGSLYRIVDEQGISVPFRPQRCTARPFE